MPRSLVLVTRPEPGLSETMAAVQRLGFNALACPLLRIRHVVPKLPANARIAAVLVSSGQAIASLDRALDVRRLPLFAVGDATALRASAAGFEDVRSASGDADDLARLALAQLPAGMAVLLATTSGQGTALASRLRKGGLLVHRRVAYRVRPASIFPLLAASALQDGSISSCLFFSAETAKCFARLLPADRHGDLAGVRALALSQPVGEALASLPWLQIEISDRPNAASLLSLLERHQNGGEAQP